MLERTHVLRRLCSHFYLAEFPWGRSREKQEVWANSSSAWRRIPSCSSPSSPFWISFSKSSADQPLSSSMFLSYLEASCPNSAMPGKCSRSWVIFASATSCAQVFYDCESFFFTCGICSPRMLNISGMSFDLTGKSTESGWRTGSELTSKTQGCNWESKRMSSPSSL